MNIKPRPLKDEEKSTNHSTDTFVWLDTRLAEQLLAIYFIYTEGFEDKKSSSSLLYYLQVSDATGFKALP
jgi:hypothetical protein